MINNNSESTASAEKRKIKLEINTSNDEKFKNKISPSKSENSVSIYDPDEENVLIIDSSTDSPKKKNSIRDFEISLLLGKGSYAKVVLAKNIYNNKYYALKVIDKSFLAKVRN